MKTLTPLAGQIFLIRNSSDQWIKRNIIKPTETALRVTGFLSPHRKAIYQAAQDELEMREIERMEVQDTYDSMTESDIERITNFNPQLN